MDIDEENNLLNEALLDLAIILKINNKLIIENNELRKIIKNKERSSSNKKRTNN